MVNDDSNNNKDKEESETVSENDAEQERKKSAQLALCESLDASFNINALFDLQGEDPEYGAPVPAWKWFLPILGKQGKMTISRIVQIIKRSVDDIDGVVGDKEALSLRLKRVNAQLEYSFDSLFEEQGLVKKSVTDRN